MSDNYSVYVHKSPDGKRYVGITRRSPSARWCNGRGYSKNAHFKSAIEKYGWENFEHIVLCDGLEESVAQEVEKRLIKYWNTTNSEYGYNHHTGGEICSEEASLITSKKLKGRKGHPVSEETKKRISEAQTGRKWSAETRAKIMATRNAKTEQRLKDNPKREKKPIGNAVYCDGILYASVTECAKAIGSTTTTINPYLTGSRKMPQKWAERGLRYAYIDKEYTVAPCRGAHSKKKIVWDGVEYESQKECAMALGISSQMLSNCLKGHRKMRNSRGQA